MEGLGFREMEEGCYGEEVMNGLACEENWVEVRL